MKIARRAAMAALANGIETAWTIATSIEVGATWTAALLWRARLSLQDDRS